jgi:hypothetical protein
VPDAQARARRDASIEAGAQAVDGVAVGALHGGAGMALLQQVAVVLQKRRL